MKTVITTREFDDAGNCIKESSDEWVMQPTAACVCYQPWCSITPRHCPAHGWSRRTYVYRGGGNISSDPGPVLYNTA